MTRVRPQAAGLAQNLALNVHVRDLKVRSAPESLTPGPEQNRRPLFKVNRGALCGR